MWKKIFYFVISIIFGIIFYLLTYSSSLSEYKLELVNQAIENKEYHIVPQIFLEVPFDTKSVLEDESQTVEFEIYPAAGMLSYTLNEGKASKTYTRYEKAYLFFIFEVNFPLGTYQDGDKNVNKSAIIFSNSEKEYVFNFVQNGTINSDGYVETPKNEEEYSLNNQRDLTTINSDWGFIPISISETTINLIEEKIGNITNIKVRDCRGDIQLSEDVNLDFDEDFFKYQYIADINKNVNEKLDKYYKTTDKKELNSLTEEINELLISFKENFAENTKGTTYAISLSDEELKPASVYVKSIGFSIAYVVVISILYILLFHFNLIRSLFRAAVGKNNKTNKGNKKVQPKKEVVEECKVEPVVEEENTEKVEENTLETVENKENK